MLTEVLRLLRNWFERSKVFGTFKVQDGVLVNPLLRVQDGQYIRIIGSAFNDGVHKWGDATDVLTDEEDFEGAVWLLGIPKEVLTLVQDIEAWCADNASALNTPYQSESFGGYSYSLKSGANGGAITWQSQFGSRLNAWRKI